MVKGHQSEQERSQFIRFSVKIEHKPDNLSLFLPNNCEFMTQYFI